jgi:hypothetical protein
VLRFWGLGLALVCSVLPAQEIQLGPRPTAAKGHVVLLTDAAEVKAGHEAIVELRFRVDPGFHINSHDPKDETLIPTALQTDKRSGVDVLSVQYPAGVPFRLSLPGDAGQAQVLDVYQGEFRVMVRLVADPGETTMSGNLRYQACDNAACFPPRTLAVRVLVAGK